MSNEIISVIDHLCDKLGIAVDWTADNAMPMIQQLIEKYARYLLVNNIIWLTVSLMMLTGSITVFVMTRRAIAQKKPWAWVDLRPAHDWERDYSDTTNMADILMIVSAVVGVLSFISVFLFFGALIKAATIPEIYAAQKLMEMLSNM